MEEEAKAPTSSKSREVKFYPEITFSGSKTTLYKETDKERGSLEQLADLQKTNRDNQGSETAVTDNEVPPTTSQSHTEGPDSETDGPESKTDLFATQVDEAAIEQAKQRQLHSSGGLLASRESYRHDDLSYSRIVSNKAQAHFNEGLQLMDAHDYNAAVRRFEKAINLKPNEVDYYQYRGEAYLHLCDFQSAILNYKKTCVLQPNCAPLYNRLAFIYYFQGQCLFDQKLFPEALEAFSRATEMRPDVIGYHTRSIACLAALDRHGECLALINKRLETEQTNADLFIIRARLHQLFRNTTLCYYDVKDALAADPSHTEAVYLMRSLESKAVELRQQATNLSLVQRTRDALQKISVAIETNPSEAEFHVFRGSLHRKLGDFNSAIDDYLLAMDKTDHDEDSAVFTDAQRQLLLTYNDFAVECFTKGFFEEAIILLNKAIKGEKNEKGLYVNRGDCFLRQGNLPFALADYQQAADLDEDDTTVRHRIAALHNEQGIRAYQEQNYVECESRLTKAIQLNPGHAQYYIARCRARQMMDNLSNARVDLLTAIHLDPTNSEIIAILAHLFPGKTIKELMQGRPAEQARKSLHQLLSEQPSAEQQTLLQQSAADVGHDAAQRGDDEKVPAASAWKPGKFLPCLKVCMEEEEFHRSITEQKREMNKRVRGLLHNRADIHKASEYIQDMPPAERIPRVRRTKKGTLKPIIGPEVTETGGWRQFDWRIRTTKAK